MNEAPPPFQESLCHRCRHLRLVKTERSTFLRCAVLPNKYPPQPVRSCPLFEQKQPDPPEGDDTV